MEQTKHGLPVLGFTVGLGAGAGSAGFLALGLHSHFPQVRSETEGVSRV